MPELGPGCPLAGPLISPLGPGGPLGLIIPDWPLPYPAVTRQCLFPRLRCATAMLYALREGTGRSMACMLCAQVLLVPHRPSPTCIGFVAAPHGAYKAVCQYQQALQSNAKHAPPWPGMAAGGLCPKVLPGMPGCTPGCCP